MKAISFAILVLCFAASTAYAEQVHVPLPDVEGRYYADMTIPAYFYSRIMHIQLERTPIAVDRVWLHFVGVVSVGEVICDFEGDGVFETGPYPQSLAFESLVKDTVNGSWYGSGAGLPTENGAFEYTAEYRKILGSIASWDFLTAGYINLSASAGFGMFPECRLNTWPETTIEMAELIIDGTFQVSVEGNTWGSIKALFK